MPPEKPDITQRPIPGITWKVLWPILVGIAGVVWVYFSIVSRIEQSEAVSRNNNEILKEIRADRKEESKINDIKLAAIEVELREAKIRLTVLETKLQK